MKHLLFASERRRPRILIALLIALGALLLAGLALSFSLRSVGVHIDGQEVKVRRGSHVADLVSLGLVVRSPGDLLAAKDHRVLRPSGGESPYVIVNGHRASPGEAVRAGDVIFSFRGADLIEQLSSRNEVIPPGVRHVGSGPIESIKSGRPGLRKVVFGSVSGDTIRTQTLISPVAGVVERSRPSPGTKSVALTFDDGPWPRQTEAILKILQENGIAATFFEIGEQAKRWPKISKMLADAGMAFGNHTETHPNLARLSPAAINREIEQAETNIANAAGQRPRYLRPPGGNLSPSVYPVLARLDLRLVLWDVDTDDWKRPPARLIVSRVLAGLHPGAIILLHDGGGDRSQTIAALPTIIKELKARGYTFVTLDALAGLSKKMD